MKARDRQPYFRVLKGPMVQKVERITFSRYNYLGMSGDRSYLAAKDAIDRYGTSVGKPSYFRRETLHREIEKEIADLIGTEDSLVWEGMPPT
jgi:7-keto-8-aminopelargonate synthetase-like enzyme